MTGLERVRRVGPHGAAALVGDGAAVALGHGLEVGAGAEGAPGAGEHGHGGFRIGVEGEEGLAELVGADAVDRVASLRSVDRDHGDRALVVDAKRVGARQGGGIATPGRRRWISVHRGILPRPLGDSRHGSCLQPQVRAWFCGRRPAVVKR